MWITRVKGIENRERENEKMFFIIKILNFCAGDQEEKRCASPKYTRAST